MLVSMLTTCTTTAGGGAAAAAPSSGPPAAVAAAAPAGLAVNPLVVRPEVEVSVSFGTWFWAR
jgi:hypothetical protein